MISQRIRNAAALLGACAILLAPSLVSAASQPSPSVDQALHMMFGVHEIAQAVISPDGRRVAWVESLEGKNGFPSPNTAIYVADLNSTSAPQRITASTSGPASEDDLAWSPDGTELAFLSDAGHAGQKQLYITTLGGSPRRITHAKGDLSDPTWSPDGKTVAFLYIPNAPRASGPLAAESRGEGVIGSKPFEQRLTLADASSGSMRMISPADMYVYEYDWSPDGHQLVGTAAHGNGDNNWWIAQIYLFDTNASAPRSIYTSPVSRQTATPRWSPDGKSIAFIGGIMSDEGSVGGDIYTLPVSGGEARDVTPDIKATPTTIQWSRDSRSIIFGETVDGQCGLASLNLESGAVSTLYTGDGHLSATGYGVSVSLSRDGKLAAAVRQSFAHPPEVWAGPIGSWKQITHINAALHPAWGKAESLHWQTDIGRVQGWLLYPLHYDPSKKYGLIVSVHGGPAAANLQYWPSRRAYVAALPAAGYFVLFPNPRGSYGFGEAFTRANIKDFGGGDFRDILAGVDEAIKTVPIDPNRLGITGWSYGGYMSMWAVTQTDRFKAAVIGAGLSDWLSYYGENDIDKWMIPFFGASVYEDPAVYAKSDPMHFVKNAKTPSLLVVGDSDGECPTPQSYEFWHALAFFHVPTELVVYPHEGHGFVNPAHSRDVALRAIAWFNKYLK